MRRIIWIILLLLSTRILPAQDTTNHNLKHSKVKKGWTFGALPTISFDSDIGFEYGGLVDFYYYGDGSSYPDYMHSIYLEVSRTTKGSGINRFYYDSKYLIPGIRLTADISYLTEQAMQFYGFNGAESVYNQNWEDDSSPDYKSRVFYRHDRRIFRIMPSIQGKLIQNNPHWKWITGFAFYDTKISSVNIDKLNKGKDPADQLPAIDGLYEKYIQWGLIGANEMYGNTVTYVKGGVIFDSRDQEANPFKGIWTEAVLSYSPTFLGTWDNSYTKLTVIHRQYFTLIPDIMSMAYRLGYQGTISGKVPFYLQPDIVSTVLTSATNQGLGGSRSLRGILRNRIVGNGIAFGNFEVRWKFLRTVVFNQNLYLATNLFFDTGLVVDPIDWDLSQAQQDTTTVFSDYFSGQKEKLHSSAGIGLKVALNENFIVSCDYGRALNKNDGVSGLYIALNFLY